MEKNWLRNVPLVIKMEAEALGLAIEELIGDEEDPIQVTTNWIIQKENKERIKKLQEWGWKKERGSIRLHTKCIKFSKRIKKVGD
ncbi:hypothetical protein ACFHWD_16770 [Clostridium sp. MT-14]|uniref:hypothetical protein n=1 Tax=Clostridium sp. MT-14 TaxID=3348360 RepID=UPI0035F4C6DA